jgi:hypothetical protein
VTASRHEVAVATRESQRFPANRTSTRWRVKDYHDRFLSRVVNHEHGSRLEEPTEADLRALLRGRLP